MPRFTSRASSLAGVRDIAASVGADPALALRTVGLDPGLLSRPDARLPFERICALFEHCAVAWNMPGFGLRLAAYQDLAVLGPVALVTRMEPNLRSAIGAMIDNLVVHTNGAIASLEESGDMAVLSIDLQPGLAGFRQYILVAVGMARNILEETLRQRLKLIEVNFRQAADGMAGPAEAFFRCPVRFGAERNALIFDRKALDRRLEQSDAAYHPIISRYLKVRRDEESGSIVDLVRGEIARQMEFGPTTLEDIARRLRVEPRSLQRRLGLAGHSFRDLVEDWRRERAGQLVAATRLPLSEISLALGYTDQSTFSRAFRRWYGRTPQAARQGRVLG